MRIDYSIFKNIYREIQNRENFSKTIKFLNQIKLFWNMTGISQAW